MPNYLVPSISILAVALSSCMSARQGATEPASTKSSVIEIETMGDTQTVPLRVIAETINSLMRKYHYDPSELAGEAYTKIESAILLLASQAEGQSQFVDGFRSLWEYGPFSHVELRVAQSSAAETAAYLDQMRVGEDAASLEWRGDIAILTVNTMMGQDTIQAIDHFYDTIRERDAERLIIDLRLNGGGAFAMVPLVENAIDTPLDAGIFVAQAWNAKFDSPPTMEDINEVTPWTGWSIRSFWADAAEDALTRIRFEPRSESYAGPIYVLTSKRTASAAEMAADAFKASGRATLIGETTAGEMLSQKMFDVPGGLILSLPIADYYSTKHGRIEGNGVKPHIEIPAIDALAFALCENADHCD